MKSIKCLIISLLVMLSMTTAPLASYAQSYHTNSKKAIKNYKTAKKMYDKKKYPKTYKYLNKALDIDAKFTDALLLKAELSMKLDDDEQAIESFEKMFAADSMAFPKSAISLANLYMKNFRFGDAVDILKWYVKVPNQKSTLTSQAKDLLVVAEFRDKTYNNPVVYDPINLGENVNTAGDEYINQIMPDNSRIYFTRRGDVIDKHGLREEFIYSSSIVNGDYMPALPLNLDWHNNKRMGAVSIAPNQRKMYFVGIDFIDSHGRGDIYCSELVDNRWSTPENLGNIVNTSTMESQPCISADGTELYFARYSRTYESTDLYYSQFYQGKWSNPKPIVPANTKGNEMSPFIHPDGNTLYFASDGLPGMGGYDIFMCKKLPRGEWSTPKNLGYPINSEKNEISFVVSSDGKKGYISTDRDGGMGGYDIYVFDLDRVDAPDTIDMTRFMLRNVMFTIDSPALSKSAYYVIDKLSEFLKENPSINIEIAGYTDNTGTDEHNLILSMKRADAVRDALVEYGVDKERMTTVGYGANNPVVPNDTDENKALNRRVEIRVTN